MAKKASTKTSRITSNRDTAAHNVIKQKLIAAGKVLVAEGQDDFTRGHISFRLPDNPQLSSS